MDFAKTASNDRGLITGMSPETRLRRCDLIIQLAQELYRYEKLGVFLTHKPAF